MECKILYRHPDAANRKLPPKVLEFHDKKEDTLLPYVAENVNGSWIYTVPLKAAQRLLANQPERYFLLEPSSLTVRVRGEKEFSFKHITVKARTDLMAKFSEADSTVTAEAEAKSKADADAQARTEAKAKEEAGAQAAATAKAKADAEALEALQNAELPAAGDARPPEL